MAPPKYNVATWAPCTEQQDVTPNDTNTLPTSGIAARGGVLVYVGTGGDIAVILAGSSTACTYKNVPSGTWLPLLVSIVKTTGTGAADIRAAW